MRGQSQLRLAGLACLLIAAGGALAACNRGAQPDPAAEQAADVRANFDTDLPASSMLRDRLAREFGMAPDIAAVEEALSADGFFCGPDPGFPDETACLREKPRGSCVEASLVRTRPWRPDRAQVVVICEPGQSQQGAPTP